MAAAKLRLLRTPVIYRETSSPRTNVRPGMHWAYRWLIGKANRVIAQNHSARNELASLGVPPDRIAIVSNPCPSLASLADLDDRPKPAETPLLLGVGRLAPEKGFDRLIRAFPSCLQIFSGARLVILGDGAQRAKLEGLIQDLDLGGSVSLPGWVDDPGPWYRKADLFVLPSHYEGQPNALMEAIAHGCPVVCAAGKGGIVEMIEACGLDDCLVPENAFEQSLAKRAREILKKDGATWRRARSRLVELAHPDTVLARYLEVCGVPAAAGFGRDPGTDRSRRGAAETETT